MSQIAVSDGMYNRVLEFKPVLEAVIEETLDVDTCAEVILMEGLDSMLADLIGSLDHSTLLSSFQQMASRNPSEVYSYILETLQRGTVARQKEALRRKLGFALPRGAEELSD
jgi:hypothetical protein